MRLGRIAFVLSIAFGVGCSGSSELYVDVRTDLRPGHEFVLVRTSLVGASAAGGSEAAVMVGVGEDDRYLGGARVAEFTAVTPPQFAIRVSLVDQDGLVVVERSVRIERSSDQQGVTVVLARDCVTVECPAPADTTTATECAGGRCAEQSCSPETPEACPPPECMDAGDCGVPAGGCGAPLCVDGTCLVRADDSLCAPSQRCSQELGCVPDAGLLDPQLFAWFPLADDPSDGMTLEAVSGGGGVCTECPTLSSGGPLGAYQLFDGVDDRFEFPSDARLDTAESITVAAWARLDVLQQCAIVAKPLGSGSGNAFEIKFNGSGSPVYNSGGSNSITGTAISTGEWHHICGTHEGGAKILYVDGVEVSRSDTPLVLDDNLITIGADYNSGSLAVPFAGGLADVRIYDRVLTPTEVMALATPDS